MCQPEAQSAPKCERAAAASSRWNGCGSKRRANALISSAVNVWLAELEALADDDVLEEFHERPLSRIVPPPHHQRRGQASSRAGRLR